MRTFLFNKLVRDNIPDDQRRNGADVTVRTLNKDEYLTALAGKLLEEGREIDLHDRVEAIKEIADVQEVLDCMVQALGAAKSEVEAAQAAKRAKAGSFSRRQYVGAVSVDDNSDWIQYYLANPDRYPEVVEPPDKNM